MRRRGSEFEALLLPTGAADRAVEGVHRAVAFGHGEPLGAVYGDLERGLGDRLAVAAALFDDDAEADQVEELLVFAERLLHQQREGRLRVLEDIALVLEAEEL